MKKNTPSEVNDLRQRAEEQLSMKLKKSGTKLSSSELKKLIYELEVHQVELELQNEELIEAKNQATIVSEKYTELYDFAPAGYFTLSTRGEILEINIAGAKMLGNDRLQLKNKLIYHFISSDTQKIFSLFLKKIFVSNVKESCELALISNADSLRHAYFEGIVSENGEQCLLTVIDITERKVLESKLITSNTLLEEVERSGKIGGWTFDVETQIQNWTRETFEIFEMDTAKGEPKVPEGLEFVDEPYRHFAENAIQRAIEYGESYEQEWLVTTAKGNKRWVNSVGKARTYHGRTISISGSFQDITRRKQAELELVASNKNYETLFNENVDGITIFNIGKKELPSIILDLNEGAATMLGYPKEELIKINPNDLEPNINPETLSRRIEELKTKGNSNFETTLQCRNGDKIVVDIKSLVINYANRLAIMNIARDITQRKLIENELTIAKEHAEESDRLKSAFLANMSHEIRTPMNGILGFANLLKEPGLSGEKQQAYIKIIEKSGARMLNIINDIVDISKIEAGLMNVTIRETDINEKIEFIYIFFKPQVDEKRMQLLFKNTLPAKEATIRTDIEKVYSILTNLVKNAIKYSNKGTIEFGYIKKGEVLEFYVKDTGIGIPKDRQAAIFERFIQADVADTRAFQGAGLGLSISKAYVEMLGGTIWAESEEGIGSTFYFTLPYNAEPDRKKAIRKVALAHNEKNQIKDLKILIAEDDEASEMLITINVNKFGKKILKARSGFEAVEFCRNNPDLDLILMDIQMPVINGYEATRQIRQFNTDIVIIAQTAFGLSGDREKAIEAGCNDYIAKPINKDELLSLIQKYFNN